MEINLVLNGNNVTGNQGETILEVAERHGIKIPTLCNDKRIEPYTSCYICVVEVEGMRGLQPACSTKISEGMKVTTDNEKVFNARKTALDLMLSNHYADCIGPCKQTCPAGVDVQGYISYIEKGMYSEAIEVIKETNPLPAICGRVCVRPCEVACRRNFLGEETGVGIDYLKRFASDIDLESPNKFKPKIKASTGKNIAVIGAGPGGLAAAFFLQKEGHQADIFEASPKAGGWLRYGIPEYRLPNDLLQKEVDNITELGVNIHYNKQLGKNLSYKDLKEKYNAVIVAIGSQTGTSIGCEGDDAENVFSGIDFLKQMEVSGEKYDFRGKTVGVIGGGNTAMDCCRTSIRCGAKKVYVIYRRTEKEMPANPIEIHESKLEGVEYMFLTAPTKVNKDENGKLKSITCIKMELGEPDASGRRRPVPVAGSDTEIFMDVALAAIGQKTNINFIEDLNSNNDQGEFKPNKWGDIDADPKTLQTGAKNVFACGDGVTGPATLIQAVGQAKIAARSCHQFLTGQPIVPEAKEFISKRENFKEQKSEDYIDKYENQHRHEMPTLEPNDRLNFKEVELGYENEDVAIKETQRCLECGCNEYFDCKLKEYATVYGAEQKHYEGEYIEHNIDFRHPYVEIDNNKCILCARCVRICSDVVGANALGMVNRGFKTYIAPSMGNSLQETDCESCGMCISTCPTGAITENFAFKPGPVKLDTFETICNYCSVGCKIKIHHKNGFVMKVTGAEGLVNTDGNICRFAKFGYSYLNDKNRITKPLLKQGDKFVEISFEEAYKIIAEKIKTAAPGTNAFFPGARLSNEEIYSIQKLARISAKTNNLVSFHYLGRCIGNKNNSVKNVPFNEIKGASRIYIIGSELNKDNGVVNFMVSNARKKKAIPVELITSKENSSLQHKVDKQIKIKEYYYFVKAVNHYLLSKGLENKMFLNDNTKGFEEYKSELLKENFDTLCQKASNCKECIIEFAEAYNNEMNAILIFSEKEISANTSVELYNLAMITGKLGKTSNGLISLKEKCNAQGVFDMGACQNIGVGGVPLTDSELQQKLKETWHVGELPVDNSNKIYTLLEEGMIKNFFIFGEDPADCANVPDAVRNWFDNADFIMVQDYFMTETAKYANLILPASLPFETGGSFTNAQRIIQTFEKASNYKPKVEKNNIDQLIGIMNNFAPQSVTCAEDVMAEVISLLPENSKEELSLKYTSVSGNYRFFKYGCDAIAKRFNDEFAENLQIKFLLHRQEV